MGWGGQDSGVGGYISGGRYYVDKAGDGGASEQNAIRTRSSSHYYCSPLRERGAACRSSMYMYEESTPDASFAPCLSSEETI